MGLFFSKAKETPRNIQKRKNIYNAQITERKRQQEVEKVEVKKILVKWTLADEENDKLYKKKENLKEKLKQTPESNINYLELKKQYENSLEEYNNQGDIVGDLYTEAEQMWKKKVGSDSYEFNKFKQGVYYEVKNSKKNVPVANTSSRKSRRIERKQRKMSRRVR